MKKHINRTITMLIVIALISSILLPTAFAATLSEGSRGDSVRTLQAKLNALGYSVGTVDGSYGKKTAAAVSAFQQDHGLRVTGIADDNTQRAIFSTLTASAAYELAKKSDAHYEKKNGRLVTCSTSYTPGSDFYMKYEVFTSNGYNNYSYSTYFYLSFNDKAEISSIRPHFTIRFFRSPIAAEPTMVNLTINGETETLPSSMWDYSAGTLSVYISDDLDLLRKLIKNGGAFVWSNLNPSSLCAVEIEKNSMEYKAMNEVWAVLQVAGLEPIMDGTIK